MSVLTVPACHHPTPSTTDHVHGVKEVVSVTVTALVDSNVGDGVDSFQAVLVDGQNPMLDRDGLAIVTRRDKAGLVKKR